LPKELPAPMAPVAAPAAPAAAAAAPAAAPAAPAAAPAAFAQEQSIPACTSLTFPKCKDAKTSAPEHLSRLWT